MSRSIFRQLQLATYSFVALVVVALIVSAGVSFWEQRQLHDAHAVLERLHRFESVHLVAERRLTLILTGQTVDEAAARAAFDREIENLIALANDPETPVRLQALRSHLGRTGAKIEVADMLLLFNQADDREQARQEAVLGDLEHRSATQLKLEMAAPLAILATGLLLFPVARQRIIKPLNAFGRLLGRLAEGEFTPAPVDSRVDPFILPLHRQFNTLASRLQELEEAHRTRAQSLEAAVRKATAHLLEQQRNLARAERLAVTGEFAASVAHELRNPLAGLQMTLANLRTDIEEPQLRERVDLMIHEVGRLTRLLNQLLDTARHEPEASQSVRLADLVDEILALHRYQLAPKMRLENHVDKSLVCQLPADRLRQALLNLIINASLAMAGRGGLIRIDASIDGPSVRITVSDDGPGFPAEILERGVRPFFSTREQGTGLGLAVVRRFARDVGGTLELTNLEPHGARVTLILPREPEHA